MRRAFPLSTCPALVLSLATLAQGASAQAFPVISGRTYTAGNVLVVMTGSFTIREEVAINTQASFSDGEMTWLQFGVSGSDKLDALITFNSASREIGIGVGRKKIIAIGGIMAGEKSECTGKTEVTATLVSGEYECKGLTSHDPATGKLGTVDMTVTLTARS